MEAMPSRPGLHITVKPWTGGPLKNPGQFRSTICLFQILYRNINDGLFRFSKD
jgi:hypothetical protein